MWGRQARSLKLNEAGRPGPLAYPQAVWGRQVLILKLNEAGLPVPLAYPQPVWGQAESSGQACATHLLILKLCGATRRLASS